MANIQALKDLATALAKGGSVIADVLDDGKVDFKDIGKAPAALSCLRAFTGVDYSVIGVEVSDLTQDEVAELAAHFAAEFNLKNDTLEAQVEAGLVMLVQVAGGIQAVYNAVKDLLSKKPAS